MEREWIFEDEHRMFRESLHKWIVRELAPHADEWEEKQEFPMELYRKVGEQGFFGGGIPEKYGGGGGDFRYKVVFAEQMVESKSAGTSAGLILHDSIALPIRNNFASEELKQSFLVPGVRGEKVGALAVTEPDGGYGYMMEYDIQRIWRDGRIGTIGSGTSEIQREIIGRLLGL
jgi:alkylation response protein AidB-like acyl-CoA dehydrogenase